MAGIQTTLTPKIMKYTSGTTGFPKGATLVAPQLLNNGTSPGVCSNYTKRTASRVQVPLYHCVGMVLGNPCHTNTATDSASPR